MINMDNRPGFKHALICQLDWIIYSVLVLNQPSNETYKIKIKIKTTNKKTAIR